MRSIIKIPEETSSDYQRIARIYKILLDATNVEYNDETFKEVSKQVTLKTLSDMDTDMIRLTTVLDEESNSKIYNILRDMTYVEENGKIRVGDLTRTDITHIRLYNVLPVDGNERTYEVLIDISYENVLEQLIIDQMIKEKMDEEAIYDDMHNWADYYSWDYTTKATATQSMRNIYKNLGQTEKDARRHDQETYYSSLTLKEKEELITVASLDKADVSAIKLTSVLKDKDADNNPKNEKLYSIIRDMTHKTDNAQITVADLENADIEHIKLLNVLPIGDEKEPRKNEELYNVLRDLSYQNVINQYIRDNYNISNETWEAAGEGTVLANGKTKSEIRQEAVDMYALLDVDQRNNLITVASLDGGNIGDIKLVTVMGEETGNDILDAVLKKPNITVSNIGDNLNDLTLTEIYNVEVFTKDSSKAVQFFDGKYARYNKDANSDTYYYNASGEYYLSKKSSVWLFMLYDGTNTVNDDGFAITYTANGKKLSELNNETTGISSMGGKVSMASIRQLIACGIISDDDEGFYFTTHIDPLDISTPILYHEPMEKVLKRS